MQSGKLSYSGVTKASQAKKESPHPTYRHRVTFRAPKNAAPRNPSSVLKKTDSEQTGSEKSDSQTTNSQKPDLEKTDSQKVTASPSLDMMSLSSGTINAIEEPAKVPKTLSYEWDPQYVAAGATTYAEEKATIKGDGTSKTTVNGLCCALESHLQSVVATEFAQPTEDGFKVVAKKPVSGLRAAVEAAARESAAQHNSSKSSKSSNPRVIDFLAGKPIALSPAVEKISTRDTASETVYVPNPRVPSDHASDSDQSSGQIGYIDSVTKYGSSGRFTRPLSPETRLRLHKDREAANPKWTGPAAVDKDETSSVDTVIHLSKHSSNEPEPPSILSRFNDRVDNNEDSDGFMDAETQGINNSQFSSQRTESHSPATSYSLPAPPHWTRLPMFGPRANAGWSQTMTWVSNEEEERERFSKIQANMSYAGFDKSPFVPKSFNEYVGHKNTHTQSQQRLTSDKIQGMEQSTHSARQHLLDGGDPEYAMPPAAKPSPKLIEIGEEDGLTPVMSRPSIWTKRCFEQAQVDWPPYVAYKAEGDERARGHYGRYLPIPRTRCLAEEHYPQAFAAAAGDPGAEPLPFHGHGVPWDKRKVAGFAKTPVYDMMTLAEAENIHDKPEELSLSDVSYPTAKLILDNELENYGHA